MESEYHKKLVRQMYDYVSNLKGVQECLIECDLSEITGNVTRTYEGYVPDLYYEYGDICIIGEAKTTKDLDRKHSINQYKSYIQALAYRKNNYNTRIILISVTWEDERTAQRIISRLLEGFQNITLIVLSQMGAKIYEKNNFK